MYIDSVYYCFIYFLFLPSDTNPILTFYHHNTVFTQMQGKVPAPPPPFKFGVWICGIILNLYMKWGTGLCQPKFPWTRPWGAKPRPALPSLYVQKKERTGMTQINWHNFFFWFNPCSSILKSRTFQKPAVFCRQTRKHLTW